MSDLTTTMTSPTPQSHEQLSFFETPENVETCEATPLSRDVLSDVDVARMAEEHRRRAERSRRELAQRQNPSRQPEPQVTTDGSLDERMRLQRSIREQRHIIEEAKKLKSEKSEEMALLRITRALSVIAFQERQLDANRFVTEAQEYLDRARSAESPQSKLIELQKAQDLVCRCVERYGIQSIPEALRPLVRR